MRTKREVPVKPKVVNDSPKYCAYTILPKEKTGGLYILRKLVVGAGQIERIEDDIEDLFSIKAAKLADALHGILG